MYKNEISFWERAWTEEEKRVSLKDETWSFGLENSDEKCQEVDP